MKIRAAYNQWAPTYDADRNLTRDLDETITRTTLASVPCTHILELGCGTGKNTIFLAQLGAAILALDFADAMLKQAQAKLPHAHVMFTVADLTAPWPCADQAVDLVVGNLVLEHIADLPFIFAEAHRCLGNQGRMFVCELHPCRQYLGAQATFQCAQVQIAIPACVHLISDFLTAAEQAGFELAALREWWHPDDHDAPPRLISFLFEKPPLRGRPLRPPS